MSRKHDPARRLQDATGIKYTRALGIVT